MNTTTWMIVAFVAVGAGIGGYLLSITARRRQAHRRLKEFEGRAERS